MKEKLVESYKLCKNKWGEQRAKNLGTFLDSLRWKKWRVDYHAKASEDIIEKFFSASKVTISRDNPKLMKAWESSIAEVEAMIQVSHSLSDVLAQIVNIAILESPEPENDVDLKRIKEKNLPSEIKNLLLAFWKSPEFKYIGAFCNTIKHRKLIPNEFSWGHIDFVEEKDVFEKVITFKEFEYKKHPYPSTTAKDIREHYRKVILDKICKIIDAINNWLKNA